MTPPNTPKTPERIIQILRSVISSASGEIASMHLHRRLSVADTAALLELHQVIATSAGTACVRTIELLSQLSLEELADLQKWAATAQHQAKRDAKRQASRPSTLDPRPSPHPAGA